MTSSPTDPMDPGATSPVSESGGEVGQIKLGVKEGAPTRPAGFWVRFAAIIIDGVILGIALVPIWIVLGIVFGMAIAAGADPAAIQDNTAMVVGFYISYYAVYFVCMFLYFGWFYKNKGATPGKLIFKLRVHHAEFGRYIGYWHAFGRETLGKMISFLTLLIGYLMVVFHPEKRALHDLIFRTRVVRSE